MRQTVVPAQVTTVEDRIMGNLGLSQIMLLVLPIFISAGLFVFIPPFMHGSLPKYILMAVFANVSAILAIRIKGKIILLWLVTITRYNLRPKFYLFQKATTDYRKDYAAPIEITDESKQAAKETYVHTPKLGFTDAAYAMEAINDPERSIRFEMNKKGGLHVRITEIEN